MDRSKQQPARTIAVTNRLFQKTIVEKAVVNGIGKIAKIDLVKIQVALKSCDDAKSIQFSHTSTSPLLVLRLPAGPLALISATFLVSDDELVVEVCL